MQQVPTLKHYMKLYMYSLKVFIAQEINNENLGVNLFLLDYWVVSKSFQNLETRICEYSNSFYSSENSLHMSPCIRVSECFRG